MFFRNGIGFPGSNSDMILRTYSPFSTTCTSTRACKYRKADVTDRISYISKKNDDSPKCLFRESGDISTVREYSRHAPSVRTPDRSKSRATASGGEKATNTAASRREKPYNSHNTCLCVGNSFAKGYDRGTAAGRTSCLHRTSTMRSIRPPCSRGAPQTSFRPFPEPIHRPDPTKKRSPHAHV